MSTMNPTGKQIKALANQPEDTPFVMVNLLKFKPAPEGSESGEVRYNRYGANIMPLLKQVGGRILWIGGVDQIFIGLPEDGWDRVMLVQYPSRKAFLRMISMPEYQAIQKDREEGLYLI